MLLIQVIEQSFDGLGIIKGAFTSIILASLYTFKIVVDSLTVAKSILLRDKFENLGAWYVFLYNIDDVCTDASPSLVQDVARK
jgi:hypothetical protein